MAEKNLSPSDNNPDINNLASGQAVAYVDGSYDVTTERFSYGIVMFAKPEGDISSYLFEEEPGRVKLEFKEALPDGAYKFTLCKAFSHKELASMRNVAGEIMGSAQAMKSAAELGLKHITICHDYEGIAAWCTGAWKAKLPWTQKYKGFYDEMKQKIKIDFVKVKGHSKNPLNDLADSLAKEALGK
ncbi:MAG: RNase H [Parasporobacterium sp.]|nr:RNase H [Parasporobacterium sp.]